MTNKKHLRRQLFIERGVQTEVICRASLYCVVGICYFAGVLLHTHWSANPHLTVSQLLAHFLEEAMFWIPAVFVVVPVMVYDILKMTHRIVGPVHRLRLHMNRLAEGDVGESLRFRKDDYFQDLCTPFNAIRQQLIDGGVRCEESSAHNDDSEAITTENEATSQEGGRESQGPKWNGEKEREIRKPLGLNGTESEADYESAELQPLV